MLRKGRSSMGKWEVLDTGAQSAAENMRLDAELLQRADQLENPVLHFYEWAGDSATYGYFTRPSDFLRLDRARGLSLELAQRPTGGGIIFHLWDMAFSAIVPSHCPEFSMNTLENYAFVNHIVLACIKEFLNHTAPLTLTPDDFAPWDASCSHFCMAKPTKYDVMWEGKKVAGAAQRKTKKGFLHQGSIALIMPPQDYLNEVLIPGTKVSEAIRAHACPLLGKSATPAQMALAKQSLRSLLNRQLTDFSSKIEGLNRSS